MSQTSDRYAQALFDLAKERNSLEAVQETLTNLRKVIAGSVDFRAFLGNPLLSYEESTTVLKALFEGKVPDLLYRFLTFITYKSRLDLLAEMIGSFDNMYLADTHQTRAYVRTAMDINDEEKGIINKKLEEKFQQKVISRFSVDPALIGGFRIFARGKLYDYSFKDQLESFLQQTT